MNNWDDLTNEIFNELLMSQQHDRRNWEQQGQTLIKG